MPTWMWTPGGPLETAHLTSTADGSSSPVCSLFISCNLNGLDLGKDDVWVKLDITALLTHCAHDNGAYGTCCLDNSITVVEHEFSKLYSASRPLNLIPRKRVHTRHLMHLSVLPVADTDFQEDTTLGTNGQRWQPPPMVSTGDSGR